RGEMPDDTLVEAFEARREERQALFLRKLLHHALRELAALWTERDHTVRRSPAVDSVERRRDHVDAQHHSGAAAVRLVVDLCGSEGRRVPVREEPGVELAPEHARD